MYQKVCHSSVSGLMIIWTQKVDVCHYTGLVWHQWPQQSWPQWYFQNQCVSTCYNHYFNLNLLQKSIQAPFLGHFNKESYILHWAIYSIFCIHSITGYRHLAWTDFRIWHVALSQLNCQNGPNLQVLKWVANMTFYS